MERTKGIVELTISIDRQARAWAVFEDSACVKDFEPFTDEAKALADARAWVAERSSVEPEIVYPRITAIRMRS
jgi:hypothetical protein